MLFEVVYEKNNSTEENKIKFEHSSNISIEELLELFPDTQDKIIKCWIFYNTSKSWIACPNDIILNLLITSFISENPDQKIIIFLRESDYSPNTTPSIIGIDYNSKISNEIEPFSQEEAILLEKSDLLGIPSSKELGSIILINSHYIIDFVKTELFNDKFFFDISLNVLITDLDEEETIIFNREIWTNYFVKGHPNSTMLLDFFSNTFLISISAKKELYEFHSNEYLLNRLKYFIYDLTKFNSNTKSQEHLFCYSVYHPEYYFSLFYFTEPEIEYLLHFPTSSGLIYTDLFDIFIRNKRENGGEICTSHDIAPFIYKTFGIRKGFENESKFKTFMKSFKGPNR